MECFFQKKSIDHLLLLVKGVLLNVYSCKHIIGDPERYTMIESRKKTSLKCFHRFFDVSTATDSHDHKMYSKQVKHSIYKKLQ